MGMDRGRNEAAGVCLMACLGLVKELDYWGY